MYDRKISTWSTWMDKRKLAALKSFDPNGVAGIMEFLGGEEELLGDYLGNVISHLRTRNEMGAVLRIKILIAMFNDDKTEQVQHRDAGRNVPQMVNALRDWCDKFHDDRMLLKGL